MPYLNVPDAHYSGPEYDAAGLAEIGLDMLARLHANTIMSDGVVSLAAVRRLGREGAEQAAERLVELELWERVDSGYRIRGYLGVHRSREQIEALVHSKAEAGKRGGIRSGQTRATRSKSLKHPLEAPASSTRSSSREPTPLHSTALHDTPRADPGSLTGGGGGPQR